MKYKVYDTETNVDVTSLYSWVISPSGNLWVFIDCDLIKAPSAYQAVSLTDDR